MRKKHALALCLALLLCCTACGSRSGQAAGETAAAGESGGTIARFALDTIIHVVLRATRRAQERYPGLPVLCSGGVASNRQLRAALSASCQALFAQPQYATDNAMGTAILTWRALERGGEAHGA